MPRAESEDDSSGPADGLSFASPLQTSGNTACNYLRFGRSNTKSAKLDKEETRSDEEREFVLRLDLVLLVFCCVSQVIKGLDQQSQCYVLGVKQI